MYKKVLLISIIMLAGIFTFTFCFANNDGMSNVVNDVRNVVGGVEDSVENAAKDVSNTSKNATSGMENSMDTDNNNHTNNNNVTSGNNKNNVNAGATNYNAVRTSTTLMGMTSTAWTWLILGIAAVAIIALVWYYSMQVNNSNHKDD